MVFVSVIVNPEENVRSWDTVRNLWILVKFWFRVKLRTSVEKRLGKHLPGEASTWGSIY